MSQLNLIDFNIESVYTFVIAMSLTSTLFEVKHICLFQIETLIEKCLLAHCMMCVSIKYEAMDFFNKNHVWFVNDLLMGMPYNNLCNSLCNKY
jgi:hypothetical protein